MAEFVAAIDPTRESFKQMFSAVPADRPVLMLNLVRFRDVAVDTPGCPTRSGRDAYMTYLRLFRPLMAAKGGREYWSGRALHTLIAPPEERWDEIIIIEYPRLAAFAALIQSHEYKTILPHRLAGISDTRLVITEPASGEATLRAPDE